MFNGSYFDANLGDGRSSGSSPNIKIGLNKTQSVDTHSAALGSMAHAIGGGQEDYSGSFMRAVGVPPAEQHDSIHLIHDINDEYLGNYESSDSSDGIWSVALGFDL